MNQPSSPASQPQAHDARERQRRAKAAHWQRFKTRHHRVYGTLTLADYREVGRRAKEHGRSLWGQIWAESRAYARNEFLPSRFIERRTAELHADLRRIGNELNQIARKTHILGVLLDPPAVRRLIARLEAKIADFTRRPWR